MLEFILKGGSMMVPLMAESVICLAVLFERALAFYQNRKVDVRALRAEVLGLLAEGRLDDAIMICASTPSPVSAVMLVGLQTYQKLKESGENPETMRALITKSMEDYSLHALTAVQKRLNVLISIGNSAPLFGMCGTVTGMITAFGAMASAAALDSGLVAAGIAEALITTAAGLIIALAAVIPLNVFNSMAEDIELEIGDAASELVEFIALRLESSATR